MRTRAYRKMVTCSVSVLMAAIANAQVALLNGGLADGDGNEPAHWTVSSLAKVGRTDWGSHDGDGWLMALFGWGGDVDTYGEIRQDVANVVAGNIYTLAFWQDGDASWNGFNVTARLIWLDAVGNPLGSVAKNLDASTNSSWTYHTVSGTAPAGAVAVRVQFDAETLAVGGGGAAKLDEITLDELPPGLLNPGFWYGSGTDAYDWEQVYSVNDARREPWGSHDNDGWLMSLPGYAGGTYGAFYQDIADARPRERFTLSFWQEGDVGWNGANVTASIVWLDAAYNTLGRVTKNLDAWAYDWGWVNHVITGSAPAGTATVRIQFEAESPAFGGGAAKFDDLLLTREYPDGTFISVQ